MRIGKTGWWRAGIVVLIGMAAFAVYAPPATTQSTTPPQYDSSGNLLRPVGFETWVLAGSNLGLAYKTEPTKTGFAVTTAAADRPMFHNVYISPQAYEEFVRTQTFPDRTVLVIDVLTAADKEPKGVLSAGVYNGDRVAIEVAVKNMHRPDGKTTPWAYYQFPLAAIRRNSLTRPLPSLTRPWYQLTRKKRRAKGAMRCTPAGITSGCSSIRPCETCCTDAPCEGGGENDNSRHGF